MRHNHYERQSSRGKMGGMAQSHVTASQCNRLLKSISFPSCLSLLLPTREREARNILQLTFFFLLVGMHLYCHTVRVGWRRERKKENKKNSRKKNKTVEEKVSTSWVLLLLGSASLSALSDPPSLLFLHLILPSFPFLGPVFPPRSLPRSLSPFQSLISTHPHSQ